MTGRVKAVTWLLYFTFILFWGPCLRSWGCSQQFSGSQVIAGIEPGAPACTVSSPLGLAPHLLMWCRKVIWIMQKKALMESLGSSQLDNERPARDSMSRTRPGTWSCWLELVERAAIRKRCPCLVSGKSRYWLSSSASRMAPIYQHLKFNPWLNSPFSSAPFENESIQSFWKVRPVMFLILNDSSLTLLSPWQPALLQVGWYVSWPSEWGWGLMLWVPPFPFRYPSSPPPQHLV